MIVTALNRIVLPSSPPLPQAPAECRITTEGRENSIEEFKHNPAGAHSWCCVKPLTHPLVQTRLLQQMLSSPGRDAGMAVGAGEKGEG